LKPLKKVCLHHGRVPKTIFPIRNPATHTPSAVKTARRLANHFTNPSVTNGPFGREARKEPKITAKKINPSGKGLGDCPKKKSKKNAGPKE